MDERERNSTPFPGPFTDPMTRRERIGAWIYLPLHAVGIPLLLSLLATLWPDGNLSETALNIFYYALGAAFTLIFLWKYLRRAFDVPAEHPFGVLFTLVLSYMVALMLSWAVQLLTLGLGLDLSATPNNETVMDMAGQGFNAVFAMSVFLAPLVEEPLFRGAVFGSIYHKNRYAAYAVSTLLFALYHVWQYVAVYGDASYLLYMLNYVPASVALAFAYERSGSIWVPMALHAAINAASMLLLR